MPLPYHRLLRVLPSYRWWRPLLAVLLAVVLYLVLANVTVFVIVAVARLVVPEAVAGLSGRLASDALAASDPLVMLVTLGSIATMVPAVLLATATVGRGAAGRLWSVEGRLRWGWLARCLPAGVAFVAVSVGLGSVVLPLLLGEEVDPGPVTTPPAALAWSALVIVLLVPLQATGRSSPSGASVSKLSAPGWPDRWSRSSCRRSGSAWRTTTTSGACSTWPCSASPRHG